MAMSYLAREEDPAYKGLQQKKGKGQLPERRPPPLLVDRIIPDVRCFNRLRYGYIHILIVR